MGTFRNIMIILGMLFSVLVLTFAIGMFFPGFRQGLNNTFHVVPVSSYNTTLEQVQQQSTLLESLQTEKTSLENQLANVQQSFNADETEIANLETEIASLNEDITNLQNNLARISNNINGAILTYKGEEINITTPIFDEFNNYLRTDGLTNNCGLVNYYNGQDFVNIWNDYTKNTLTAFKQNIDNNPYVLQMHTNDMYNLFINGAEMQFCCSSNDYCFDGDSTCSIQIFVNDNYVDIEDVLNLINVNREYTSKIFISYSLSPTNTISNINISFNLYEI